MSQYLIKTTLVAYHITLSRSDYFRVIKQKYPVYVGALSRSQANTDDRQVVAHVKNAVARRRKTAPKRTSETTR